MLSGAIDRRGNGYEVSVKAVQTVTGNVVVNTRGRAASKEQVLDVVTRLVSTFAGARRRDVGSAQMFAMRSCRPRRWRWSGHYAAALEAQSDGKYRGGSAERAESSGAGSGVRHGLPLLGGMARNLGNLQDAEQYSSQALSYLGGMTERERFRRSRFLLPGDGRLSAVRQGIRGYDGPVCRRRRGAQPTRSVSVQTTKDARERR